MRIQTGNKSRNRTRIAIWVLGMLTLLGACKTQKNTAHRELLYVQGNLDTMPNTKTRLAEATIQVNDQLSIIVYSDNPEATALFNQPQISSSATKSAPSAGAITGVGANPSSGGYLVDHDGKIYMQTIGQMQAAGLTRDELAKQIAAKLQTYLKNPYVDIRYQNLRLTVLGEVNRPGVISLPMERISVLELVGMAGDLTIYGKRDNILVVREQNGKREFGRINLGAADVFQSPWYYLMPNDVVYVEPTKKKQTASDQELFRKLTIATSIATLLTSLTLLITIF